MEMNFRFSLFGEIMSVLRSTQTTHTHTLCGQNAEFLNLVVCKVATGPSRIVKLLCVPFSIFLSESAHSCV